MEKLKVGDSFVCAETGKKKLVVADGFTFNYCTTSAGEILSDEGAYEREKRELHDRSKPLIAYINGDCTEVTTWKGKKLGDIVWSKQRYLSKWSPYHGARITHIRVVDIFGGRWYGCSSPGMSVKLHPDKGKGQ